MNDHDLLTDYALHGNEAAFEAIVRAHASMVIGVAQRRTGSRALAEEVAQSAFTLLAQRAREQKIKPGVLIAGWLHQTALHMAARALESELSHQRRMKKYAEETPDEFTSGVDGVQEMFREALPLMDAALEELPAKDRDILMLRFYENRTLRETGERSGKSESAALRHVERALGKLSALLKRRGQVIPVAVLGTLLASSLTEAKASAALIGAITKTAVGGGSAVAFSVPVIVMSKAKSIAILSVAVCLSAVPAGLLWAERADLLDRIHAAQPPAAGSGNGADSSKSLTRDHAAAAPQMPATPRPAPRRYLITADMVKEARIHREVLTVNGAELSDFIRELLHITPEETAAANAAMKAVVDDCRAVQKRLAKTTVKSDTELELEIPSFPELEQQRLRASLSEGLNAALGKERGGIITEAIQIPTDIDVWGFSALGRSTFTMRVSISGGSEPDQKQDWVRIENTHENGSKTESVPMTEASRLEALRHLFHISGDMEFSQ